MGYLEDRAARRQLAFAADQKIRIAAESAAAKSAARQQEWDYRNAVAAEQRTMSQPQTVCNFDVPEWAGILVSDPRAVFPWVMPFQPPELPPGDGPLVWVFPDGSLGKAPRTMVTLSPELGPEAEFLSWVRGVAPLIDELRARHPGVVRLRDQQWLAHVATACGLGIPHSRTENWQGHYGSGTRTVTTVEIPVPVGARVAADGLRIRFRHRSGDSAAQWEKALPALTAELAAAGFTVGALAVTQGPAGDVILHLNDRADIVPVVESPVGVTPFDAETGRSYVGVAVETGEPVWIDWKSHAGLLVGGTTGGGKTGSTMPIIAGLAGLAELHVFDGKGGFDYAEFEPVSSTFDASGDLEAPIATLRSLAALIPIRAEAIYRATGKKEFWKLTPQEREQHGLAPVFVIMDEAHTWLDQSGMSPAEKKLAAEISRHVRTLILKGRFSGITTILTTQKSDATALPTRIRDNCSNRLCFRTTTQQHAKTILGAAAAEAPDPCKISAKTPGRAVALVDEGAVLVQAAFADGDMITEYLKNKQPPPDQEAAALRLAGKGGPKS
jgi:S-DNA-T family DNA segregation ATPase FtsK/SpoIIIE